MPRRIFSNGCLPNADPELDEFTMDAWRAPERIGFAHLANQISDLAINTWPTKTAESRPPPPLKPNARLMPLDNSGRLYQHHDLEALRPEPVQASPEKPISRTDPESASVLGSD